MSTDRAALGAFLRSRRDGLTPARAGIDPFPGACRVPGLRKEELAVLAGMSTDHYSRIEQGRQPTLGDDVVDALARALQLDDVERQHLRDLSRRPVRPRTATNWSVPPRADAGMLRLMTALDHVPLILLGRRSEILARNSLLCTVLDAPMEPGTTFARWLFQDPGARATIANWADFAAAAVGGLRYELGRHPDDRQLVGLVAELRSGDADIERWWGDQRVTDRTSVTKLISHPTAGTLTFGIESVIGPHDPEQRLVVYTVEPDSPTARALPLLASWGRTDPVPLRDR